FRSRSVIDRIWEYDDGGRAAAGYKGHAQDCVTRSIAIACGLPYQAVYDALNEKACATHTVQEKRLPSRARTGVHRPVYQHFLEEIGWIWTPTMGIGTGCKVHLKADELPEGSIICRVSKHLVAVIDGIIHDTHDPS